MSESNPPSPDAFEEPIQRMASELAALDAVVDGDGTVEWIEKRTEYHAEQIRQEIMNRILKAMQKENP